MITSVVNEYKWSPAIIGDFFIDNHDFEGLEFWYDEVIKIDQKINNNKNKNKKK
jgi:hypothetical protein